MLSWCMLSTIGTNQPTNQPTLLFCYLQSFETCDVIVGPLHLSQYTDCTDLLPLSNVQEIIPVQSESGELIRIDNNDALTSLEGIEQLLESEFEGDITIRKNRQLESLSSFSNLHTTTDDSSYDLRCRFALNWGWRECSH